MKTVAEMLEEVKNYYNLNDTLLAVELGIKSTGNITQWRKGETKPSKDRYIKLKAMYDEVMSLKNGAKEVVQEELFYGCRKPYEVGIPKVGTAFYFIYHNGDVEKVVYTENIDQELFMNTYLSGNLHDTEEEAKQKLKEDKLMFRIKKWLKEQQGDWKPDWTNSYQVKRSIYYGNSDDILLTKSSFDCNYISKMPIFKTDEIAEKFIEVFEREIKEVFFKC